LDKSTVTSSPCSERIGGLACRRARPRRGRKTDH
jgi:hypothetical protein